MLLISVMEKNALKISEFWTPLTLTFGARHLLMKEGGKAHKCSLFLFIVRLWETATIRTEITSKAFALLIMEIHQSVLLIYALVYLFSWAYVLFSSMFTCNPHRAHHSLSCATILIWAAYGPVTAHPTNGKSKQDSCWQLQ